VKDVTSGRSRLSDRAAVERAARELILAVVRQRTPNGTSVVVEGAPSIGKTSLARLTNHRREGSRGGLH
jgi:DNA helicase TIP49 (TBP-interacting protein)